MKNYEVRVIEDGDVSDGIKMKMKIKEERDLQAVKLTHQTVMEVEAEAGGDQIQAALDGAREGATVHLPEGETKQDHQKGNDGGETEKGEDQARESKLD